ncbi:MAG: HAD family hydrolase [Gammaproteobacteria bacterium]|nr:HAD family hydrolase [Gammaproteobacteria bacterium]
MSSPAVFLDRDGVINHDHGYVHKREDFDFIDDIFDLAREAYHRHYKIIVVTNQAGIARGYYSEDQFHKLTDWMCEQFSAAGAPIDKVYFSPYHPIAGLGHYLKDDFSRKPHPGMFLQSQEELSIDLSRSVLIGDKCSDIQAGIAAGVGTNLLFAAKRPNELNGLHYEIITSLREAIRYLQRVPQ